LTKPCCSSFDNSSRLSPLVSGTDHQVTRKPVTMKKTRIYNLVRSHELLAVQFGKANSPHIVQTFSLRVLPQFGEYYQGNCCTKLPACRRYTVTGCSVARRKYFSWNNKRCGIGPKVLEEVDKTVEEYSSLLAGGSRREFVEGRTYSCTFMYIF
jgi:hypothetical protein